MFIFNITVFILCENEIFEGQDYTIDLISKKDKSTIIIQQYNEMY